MTLVASRKLRYIICGRPSVCPIDVCFEPNNIKRSKILCIRTKCDNCYNLIDYNYCYKYIWNSSKNVTFYDEKCNKEIIIDWLPVILQVFVTLRHELISDVVTIIFDNFIWYEH